MLAFDEDIFEMSQIRNGPWIAISTDYNIFYLFLDPSLSVVTEYSATPSSLYSGLINQGFR